LGVAQVVSGEDTLVTCNRAAQALAAAKKAGRDCTWWHDGREMHPVHAVHAPLEESPDVKLMLAGGTRSAPGSDRVELTGRSVFFGNVKRRLAEWHRGGPQISVLLIRVDQHSALVARFGGQAQAFLRGVIGRLLEAASRDMDERCEFDDQTYAILLPATDNETAVHVAERLRSQVIECKIRIGKELWELSPSIGVACCAGNDGAMELLQRAAVALGTADKFGGNAIYLADASQEAPLRISSWT
jgi:diguanylate cyclase (GGDEF)-like protein